MKIPRIEPGGTKLTSQTGTAPKDIGVATKVSKEGANFAKVAGQVAQKFETIQINNEIAQTKNESRRQIRDLLLEQQKDPDISLDNQKSYTDRFEGIKAESTKNISLPYGQNEYSQWFDGKALIADTTMKNNFRAKLLSASKVEIDNTTEALGDTYINESREMALAELDKEIAEKKALGFWASNAEIKEFREETIKAWRVKEVDIDTMNSKDFVIDELEKGNKGVYADVDPLVRKQKLAIARAKKAREVALAHKQDRIKANTVMTELTMRGLDPDNENEGVTYGELEQARELKDSDGNQLLQDQDIRTLNNLHVSAKKYTAVADEDTYRKLHPLYEALIKSEEEEQIFAEVAKFRNAVTEATAEGKIKKNRSKLWLEKTDQILKLKLEGMNLSGMEQPSALSQWFSENLAMNKRILGSGLSDKQEAKAFMNMNNALMDKMDITKDYSNEEINKMATDIWNAEVIKNYPEVLGSGGVPNSIVTKDKGVVPISPNSVGIKSASVTKIEPKSDKDSFGFVVGEQRQGREYIGDNLWQKI